MIRFLARLAFATLVLTLFAFAQDEAGQLLSAGDKFAQANKIDDALKSYEKANGLRGDKCVACQIKIAYLKMRAKDVSAAIKAANKALSVATTASERADANAARGEIQLAVAGNDKRKIAAAEEAFRAAVGEDSSVPFLHQRLGLCLLKLDRNEEGKKELQTYLSLAPNAPNAATVKSWIADPRRAGMDLVPDLSFTSLKGDKVSFGDFKGKVLLLDFWTMAEWCDWCQDRVAWDKVIVKQLIKQYPSDKLVVISICQPNGDDEAKWKQHLMEKNMTNWIQYRDADFHVVKNFPGNLPFYILVDKNGFIRERVTGDDPTKPMMLSGIIKKLLAE